MKIESCPKCGKEPLLWHVIIKETYIIIGWIYECPVCKKSVRAKYVNGAIRKFNRWARRERRRMKKEAGK